MATPLQIVSVKFYTCKKVQFYTFKGAILWQAFYIFHNVL